MSNILMRSAIKSYSNRQAVKTFTSQIYSMLGMYKVIAIRPLLMISNPLTFGVGRFIQEAKTPKFGKGLVTKPLQYFSDTNTTGFDLTFDF